MTTAPPTLKECIFAVAQRLRQFIPAPRPKATKAAKSWAGLKVGDVLLDKDRGTLWAVTAVNSGGARCQQIADKPAQMALDERDWALQFVKLTSRERKARKV